ncbi:hypothetical protein FACS18945_0950 [Bacteroidia bacterium]|uniref:hypothetical protein n=1 Tax=Hydrotalea sp. AMD TaxID=2501297 RepID=UPI00102754A3|nr:hypothetical protein [Hydrotalea sp. AMD]RWZ86666.1 MAG: hypothetical protein EO766_13875 [Hydrotalea sp. AMD]GHT57217.1 hypothetical protein FACS18945_0950 [Bacteroidia bacterium]
MTTITFQFNGKSNTAKVTELISYPNTVYKVEVHEDDIVKEFGSTFYFPKTTLQKIQIPPCTKKELELYFSMLREIFDEVLKN